MDRKVSCRCLYFEKRAFYEKFEHVTHYLPQNAFVFDAGNAINTLNTQRTEVLCRSF